MTTGSAIPPRRFVPTVQAVQPLRSVQIVENQEMIPSISILRRAWAGTRAAFAEPVNVAAFFLTKSCTLSGPCPVSLRPFTVRPTRGMPGSSPL